MMSQVRAGQVLSPQIARITCVQNADDHVGFTVACHCCDTPTCTQCVTDHGGLLQHFMVVMACEDSMLYGGDDHFQTSKRALVQRQWKEQFLIQLL